MIKALRMDLINLAPGHPPRRKSHPCGSAGHWSHSHAPIPANDRRILSHASPPWETIWPKLENVEPPMVMDSQMKLINLAPGHSPICKSHPHGCRCLRSHIHAPTCTNGERTNLPVRKFAATDIGLAHVGAPDDRGFANGPDKPCPWTCPKK